MHVHVLFVPAPLQRAAGIVDIESSRHVAFVPFRSIFDRLTKFSQGDWEHDKSNVVVSTPPPPAAAVVVSTSTTTTTTSTCTS